MFRPTDKDGMIPSEITVMDIWNHIALHSLIIVKTAGENLVTGKTNSIQSWLQGERELFC